MANQREQQILDLIRADPMISQQIIAGRVGISRSSVAGHIMKLTAKGVIKGRGYVFNDAPYVAVIGGANLDIHAAPAARLRLQDSNPGTVSTAPGGVARNIAENLARLGTDCRLITALGHDNHGEILLQQGRAAGIDMRHVVQLESSQTSTCVSVLEPSGDMYVAIADMSIIDELGPQRLAIHEPMLRAAAIIIVDTNLPDSTLAWLSTTFADRPLFVDTVSSTKAVKIKPYLESVHTLKPSLLEAEALTGINVSSEAKLPALADWFHQRGVARLFITLGARGVFYSTDAAQGITNSDLRSTQVCNAGGAGDAFLAGIAYAWLQDWPLEKSTGFALAAAHLTLAHNTSNSPALSLATVNSLYKKQHAE